MRTALIIVFIFTAAWAASVAHSAEITLHTAQPTCGRSAPTTAKPSEGNPSTRCRPEHLLSQDVRAIQELVPTYLGHFFTIQDKPIVSGDHAKVTAVILNQRCELVLVRHSFTHEWKIEQHLCLADPEALNFTSPTERPLF